MAHAVYLGVQTATMVSGLSNKLVLSSVELAVHAAATALRALRPAGGEQSQPQPALADNAHVKEELEQMDIEAKIRTVHALVLTIQKQRAGGHAGGEPAKDDTQVPDESDVVGVCLEQVKEVLESITSTVTALREELDAHEQRWFATWRTPDTKHHLIALRAKILILDKRVDMLLKVKSFVAGGGANHHHEVHHHIPPQQQKKSYPAADYGYQMSYT